MHPIPERLDVPEELVLEVRRLFESGRHLEAYARTAGHPLERWPWGAPSVLAGRLAAWLGGERAGSRIHFLNWRHAPEHDEAQLFRLFQLSDSRGPLTALAEARRLLADHPFVENPRIRFDAMAHAAQLLSIFRDFREALSLVDAAIAEVPENAWFPTVKSLVLASADRVEEALEWADRSLAIRPGYRMGVLRRAEALIQLSRSDEALAFLEGALEADEAAPPAALLQAIHSEREDASSALRALEEWARRLPLMERKARDFYHGRRADLLLLEGDLEGAREEAKRSRRPFQLALAERLSEPEAARRRRVRLPVPFVRQHHLTCAPATLASLAAYWGRPAEHLEIAGAICYDGTPYYHQRRWAEDMGFHVAEFAVSYPVARELIDRSIPFTLATVEPTNAHLQAVTGYDDRSGVLILRDPTSPHFAEAFGVEFLAQYGASGPRGMVLIPESERGRLEGLELPERGLYDRLFALSEALEHHRREEAGGILDALAAEVPEHRLLWQALRSLAAYDVDPRLELKAATRLHELFPDDQWARFAYYLARQPFAPYGEQLALIDRFRLEKNAPPPFQLEQAILLASDGRLLERTERSYRRYLAMAPQDVRGLHGLANTLVAQHRHEEAAEVWRLGSTVDDTNEAMAECYFAACRRLKRSEEALAHLRARFESHGAKSPGPGIVLFQAYEALERREEGFAVLLEAVERRPGDGELRLFLADAFGSTGRFEEATAALDEARPGVPRARWLRQAARLAERMEDYSAARKRWEELLALSPLNQEALRCVVGYAAEVEGVEAALARLETLAAEHPDFVPLLALRNEWYQREGRDEEALAALHRILERHPHHDWALRDLALVLSARGEHEEALAAATHSLELAPNLTYAHGVLGEVHLARRDLAAAAAAYRRSLELSIDNVASIRDLLASCETGTEKREAIDFLREQLAAQITDGNGVRGFRDFARAHLSDEELLAVLLEARAARPELPATWTALIEERLARGEIDEAREETAGMLARFPHVADAHRLHGLVERQAGRLSHAEAAWREALRVVPGWTFAMRQLAETLEKLDRLEAAVEVYRRAVRCAPLEAPNHGMLADALWRAGEREEALEAVRKAVLLSPGYQWGWSRLHEWGARLDQPDLALETARELTRSRPREPRSWLVLADMASNCNDSDAELEAVEQGLAAAPENLPLWDRLAILRMLRGDLPGALAACSPAAFGDRRPRELRGRQAWLLLRAGQPEAAAAEFDSLLDEHPDYNFAHAHRCEMHLEADEPALAKPHAAALARLEPDDPGAHGRLADIHLRCGEREECATRLRRALNLDPQYPYALATLLDLALEDGDGPRAEELLAHARRFCEPAFALRCEILARAKLGHSALLATAFEAYLDLGEEAADTAREVVAAALEASPKGARTALERRVREGRVANGALLASWVETHRSPAAALAKQLARSGLPPETSAPGWSAILAKPDGQDLSALVRKHRSVLRSHAQLWGIAGEALLNQNRSAEASRWLDDWHGRDGDLEPWMLILFIHAAEAASGPAAAVPARRHLMASFPAFRDRYLHGIGLAWTEALEGRRAEALALLEGFDPDTLVAYYEAIYHYAHVLLLADPETAAMPSEERAEALRRHWDGAAAILDQHRGDQGLHRFRRLTAKHAYKHCPEARFLRRYGFGFPLGWLLARIGLA